MRPLIPLTLLLALTACRQDTPGVQESGGRAVVAAPGSQDTRPPAAPPPITWVGNVPAGHRADVTRLWGRLPARVRAVPIRVKVLSPAELAKLPGGRTDSGGAFDAASRTIYLHEQRGIADAIFLHEAGHLIYLHRDPPLMTAAQKAEWGAWWLKNHGLLRSEWWSDKEPWKRKPDEALADAIDWALYGPGRHPWWGACPAAVSRAVRKALPP